MAHTACYLAWIDGEAAGAATMSVQGGLAELFGASTRPLFRNRGVQTALLASRLAEAQRQGCDLATTHTEPGSASQRNVERLGFRLAYTKVHLVKSE
jgi:GNAT superfamily N-acetyltransferase